MTIMLMGGFAIGFLIAAIIVAIVFVAVYFSKKDSLTVPHHARLSHRRGIWRPRMFAESTVLRGVCPYCSGSCPHHGVCPHCLRMV